MQGSRLELRRRLEELLQEPQPLCLCLIRIGHSPETTDDQADTTLLLDALHDRLNASIRPYDLLVRWDDRSFALAMPTPASLAVLEGRVERLFKQLSSSYEDFPGLPETIPVDLGAAIRVPGESGEDLVLRTESAVVEAGHRGSTTPVLA